MKSVSGKRSANSSFDFLSLIQGATPVIGAGVAMYQNTEERRQERKERQLDRDNEIALAFLRSRP